MSLQIKKLSVSYADKPVIREVSDLWQKGEVTVLIGCNGAGKSTFLQALAGLLPAQGDLTLDGKPLTQGAQRSQIAYLPQDTSAHSSLTVLEVVLLGRLNRLGMRLPSDIVEEALEALEAFSLADLHTCQLDEISGGQRQLVFLTQALFRQPRVLLLDEPTAALDLRHQLIVLEKLRHIVGQGDTIVGLAMHDLNLAAHFADRMIGLSEGKTISAGSPEQVLTSENLRHMYRIQAEITHVQGGRLNVVPLQAV